MNIHFRLLIACLFGLLPVAVQAAAPVSVDRIIVKWRKAESPVAPASVERVQGLAGRLGQRLIRGKSIGGSMSVLQLGDAQQGATLSATLRALRADPDVELAEPDQWVKIQAYTPSDPLYAANQWYLQGTEISAIRANAAWDITKGGNSAATSTVVVAVIDTGVRLDHPDLAGKLLPGFDFVSSTVFSNDHDGWDADPSDPGDSVTSEEAATSAFAARECEVRGSSWHGTRVTGLIAANTDNGLGIAGTGFNIRVVPVRALGKCGGFASEVIAGMYWAAGLSVPPPLLQSTDLTVNANPAQVINMSLGSDDSCSAAYATAVSDITAHGVLLVASSGNDGAAVGSPASCAGALAVAGIRHAGTKVGYSNLGPEIAVAAPAGNCVNTGLNQPCLFALATTTNSGTLGPVSNVYSDRVFQPTYGTSFSSPLVAGTAGLMKAVNPALTPALLIARIKASARAFPTTSADAAVPPPACALPSVTPVQAAECICNTQVCGAGMLNADGAVQAALRPAVFAQATGVVGAGRQLTLDGSQSAAATGRSIVSYLWTVVATSGGAASPTIMSANQARATVLSPTNGSYSVQLTVTDNRGSSDSAIVTVTGVGGSSTSPPPVVDSGGGGELSILTLLLAAMLLVVRHSRRFASTPR
ncbi:MAG: S8 family serine peptidase [Steroidobacteraceae bacterium]